MSTRLQVVIDEAEMKEIQTAAERKRLNVSAWVRQTLRRARDEEEREGDRDRSPYDEARPERGGFTGIVCESPSLGYGGDPRSEPESITEPWVEAFAARDFSQGDVGILVLGGAPTGDAIEVEWHWLWQNGPVRSGHATLSSLDQLSEVDGEPLNRASLSRLLQLQVRRVIEAEVVQERERPLILSLQARFEPIPLFDLLVLSLEARGQDLYGKLENSQLQPIRSLGEALSGVEVELGEDKPPPA